MNRITNNEQEATRPAEQQTKKRRRRELQEKRIAKTAKTSLEQTASEGKTTFSPKKLADLPVELLANIGNRLGFRDLPSLMRTSWFFHDSIIPIIFKRATGKSYKEALTSGLKFTNNALSRMKALVDNEIPLSKDLLALSALVREIRDKNLAIKLNKILDMRDNLIFWKRIQQTEFDVDNAKSCHEITQAYERIIKQSHARYKFDLENCELTSIPSDLLTYFDISELNLNGNFITEIPETLGEKTHLRILSLDENEFSFLPDAICKLKDLQELSLRTNFLFTLPRDFGKLKRLQQLDLEENKLTSLPDSFCNLRALEILYLHSNKLISLPKHFGRLGSLKECTISENPLKNLPESLHELLRLNERLKEDLTDQASHLFGVRKGNSFPSKQGS